MSLIGTLRKPAVRMVVCTYCDRPSEVAKRAMSVFCPHCKKRLILEDYKIDSYYAVREFFTCGDIVVEKGGHVCAPIRAANLIVRGKVQGHATVRGALTIAKNGWFKGEVDAPGLVVEQGGMLDAFVRIGRAGPREGPR
jgi:DNA-directed RNA polymerase subunit RPC12/RpoP